jgi:hypothetical protein
MTLATSLPAGLVLLALVVGFVIGLTLGGTAQRASDRVMRAWAVRRAVQATVAELRSAPVADPTTTPDIAACGMPYHREPVGGVSR